MSCTATRQTRRQTTFLAIFNGLAPRRPPARTVTHALGLGVAHPGDRARAGVALNLLAVHEGVRDAMLDEGFPARWAPQPEWGFVARPMPWNRRVMFVVSTRVTDTEALLDAYVATHRTGPVRPAVERRVGKLLGYFTPQSKSAADCVVSCSLIMRDGAGKTLWSGPSQFGPQAVRSWPGLQARARWLHTQLDGVAKDVCPGLNWTVSITWEE